MSDPLFLERLKKRKESQEAQEKDTNHSELESDIVFELFILGCICILAFSVRLFSVIRYESIIHEFDPWFNFRVTKYLVKEGFYNFHNWFDDTTWYPLGRYIGGTLYPGLMWTAAVAYHILDALRITVDIRNVCVLLAPFMASLTTIAVYLFAKETWTNAAGLFAAMFISISPGYISRSVAGSYDNEAVAIFALVITFYLWVKSVKTGSMFWSALCSLGYFYMAASWGGYIFIVNIIPFHVLVLLLSGRYSHRVYVAYCTFYILGTIMSMTISFVSFIPVTSPEHLPSIGIFGILQIYNLFIYIRLLVSQEHMKTIVRSFIFLLAGLFCLFVFLSMLGYVPVLTGRLLALIGSTKNIAIVKSVSEHQPSPWTTFFFDLHCLTFLVPVGVYYSFVQLSDATIFSILYILFSSYFTGIMVRLVLVLTPGYCVVSAIGASETYRVYMRIMRNRAINQSPLVKEEAADKAAKPEEQPSEQPKSESKEKTKGKKGAAVAAQPAPKIIPKKSGKTEDKYAILEGSVEASGSPLVALVVVLGMTVVLFLYVVHCTYVASAAYSSPSVVLMSRGMDGNRVIFDDFREAYYWLWQNTAEDAKVMSWWDYGYQIKGMGNRTVIVDNNTRNNTHIATVGLAMASTEEMAYPILRALDVKYVLVVFGGMIGYSSDDINKFLWMVRISGGIYPRIVEADYFSVDGQYRVDRFASKTMRNCLMYRMCYYRFDEVTTEYGQPSGYDRTRRAEIGEKNINLRYLEEAFTTEHWMVRIYRVKNEVESIGGIEFPKIAAKKKSGKKKSGKKN